MGTWDQKSATTSPSFRGRHSFIAAEPEPSDFREQTQSHWVPDRCFAASGMTIHKIPCIRDDEHKKGRARRPCGAAHGSDQKVVVAMSHARPAFPWATLSMELQS